MRARPTLALLFVALAPGACATVEPPPVGLTGSAPQPIDGFDWLLHLDADTAHLAYGVPESDDLRLGLNCERGSGRVGLVTIAESGESPVIFLESGGETGQFPAQSDPSDLHDAPILTAVARSSEPVLRQFRRVGWLALWNEGEREAYAPHPASRPDIERFFAFCG